ncbi:hypothetical protein LV779_23920 [Streptomyces thinghirensis]|nr:hypothetical protein [Streptomyces thinghirensis]
MEIVDDATSGTTNQKTAATHPRDPRRAAVPRVTSLDRLTARDGAHDGPPGTSDSRALPPHVPHDERGIVHPWRGTP